MDSQVSLLTLEVVSTEAALRTFPKLQKTSKREKGPVSAKHELPLSESWAAKPYEAKIRKAQLAQPRVTVENGIHFLDLKFSTYQISMWITFPPKEFPA